MKTESVAVADLKLDAANAREHSEDQLGRLARSLEEFGQRKPIVVTHDNRVVAGNGTLKAAEKIGWESVSVVRIPKTWSEEKVRAFALADNRLSELSDWNPELLVAQFDEIDPAGLWAAGFNEMEVEDFRALMEEQVPIPFADTPDPDEQTSSKPTVTQDANYSEYLERYAHRATRAIILYYPNEEYVELVEKLTRLGEILGMSDNAATVAKLIEDRLAEE